MVLIFKTHKGINPLFPIRESSIVEQSTHKSCTFPLFFFVLTFTTWNDEDLKIFPGSAPSDPANIVGGKCSGTEAIPLTDEFTHYLLSRLFQTFEEVLTLVCFMGSSLIVIPWPKEAYMLLIIFQSISPSLNHEGKPHGLSSIFVTNIVLPWQCRNLRSLVFYTPYRTKNWICFVCIN